MHVNANTYKHTQICIYRHILTDTDIVAHSYIFMCTHSSYTYINIQEHIHILIHKYICSQTNAYRNIDTHTHIYIYTSYHLPLELNKIEIKGKTLDVLATENDTKNKKKIKNTKSFLYQKATTTFLSNHYVTLVNKYFLGIQRDRPFLNATVHGKHTFP